MNHLHLFSALINLISLTFLLTLICFSYLIFRSDQNQETQHELKPFCGTVSPINSEALRLGETLFRDNCATCHARDMRTDITGPALGEGIEAWKDYPKEDLYNFIRNSQQMIKDKHPRAMQIWEDWEPTIIVMFKNRFAKSSRFSKSLIPGSLSNCKVYF